MNAKGGTYFLVYCSASSGGFTLGYLGYSANRRIEPAVLLVWDGDRSDERLVGMTSAPRGES